MNGKGHDATISLTADGKTLYIYRHKKQGGLYVTEFDEAGNMKESSFRMRIVDVMEELIKFTLLTRDKLDWLVDRYSERQAAANLQTTKLVDDSKVLEPNS